MLGASAEFLGLWLTGLSMVLMSTGAKYFKELEEMTIALMS